MEHKNISTPTKRPPPLDDSEPAQLTPAQLRIANKRNQLFSAISSNKKERINTPSKPLQSPIVAFSNTPSKRNELITPIKNTQPSVNIKKPSSLMDMFQKLSNELRVPEIVENGSLSKSLHHLSEVDFISKHHSDEDSSQEEYESVASYYSEEEESHEPLMNINTPVKKGKLILNTDSSMLSWSHKKAAAPIVPLPELPKFDKIHSSQKNIPISQLHTHLLDQTLKNSVKFDLKNKVQFEKIGDHDKIKSYVLSGVKIDTQDPVESSLYEFYSSTVNYQYPLKPFSPSFSNILKSILLKPIRFNTQQPSTKSKNTKQDLQTKEKTFYLESELEWKQVFDNIFQNYFVYNLTHQFAYINCTFSVQFITCKDTKEAQCIIFNCPISFKNYLMRNSVDFEILKNTSSKFNTPTTNLWVFSNDGVQKVFNFLKTYKPIEIDFGSYSFPKLLSDSPFLLSTKVLCEFQCKGDKLEFSDQLITPLQLKGIQNSLAKLIDLETIDCNCTSLIRLNPSI